FVSLGTQSWLTNRSSARYNCGDVFGVFQRKLANFDGDFLDWEVLQQMCCERVRQCLDEIDRLIMNEFLRLLGYDGIVNCLADFVRHVARLPPRPKRNVDR